MNLSDFMNLLGELSIIVVVLCVNMGDRMFRPTEIVVGLWAITLLNRRRRLLRMPEQTERITVKLNTNKTAKF